MKKALFCSLLCVLAISCKKDQAMTMPDADNQYVVQEISYSTAEMTTSYPATIKGQEDIEIRPKISGFITRLCVDEGAMVHAGQTLFLIDDVQYREAVRQAQAQINVLNANIKTQELTIKNKQILFDEDVISNYDLDLAKNSLESLRAQLEQAQAQLASARDNLSYCSVKSPVDGIVGTIPYRRGSLVSASSQQALTTVSNIGSMHVYFSMTEKDLLSMTRNAGGIQGAINQLPGVSLKLADGSDYGITGTVTTVSGVIDQNTGSVQMRASFNNPNRVLRSGGTATILFPIHNTQAIIIPQKCTYEIQDKKYVYVVGEGNKVKSREITVMSQNDGTNYVVTTGLQPGERIVADAVSNLKDDMVIKPITQSQADANRAQAAEFLKDPMSQSKKTDKK